jgi:hypothetical protein
LPHGKADLSIMLSQREKHRRAMNGNWWVWRHRYTARKEKPYRSSDLYTEFEGLLCKWQRRQES